MQRDDAYYAEVEKLAQILHASKGNPRTGALDSWIQAEKLILMKRFREASENKGQESRFTILPYQGAA